MRQRGLEARSGFTMTELLVAMVIFLSVMGGLTALFMGAIGAIRQARMNDIGFEISRATFTALEKDLERAFTARERGDLYQFHGQPYGFTFVGMLRSGGIGRVSYVIHPESVEEEGFLHEASVSVEALFLRLITQAAEYAAENGADNFETMATWVQVLSTHLLNEGLFNASQAWEVVTAFNDAVAMDGDLSGAFASRLSDRGVANYTLDLEVIIQTATLRRYEEAGMPDLDTFTLPRGEGEELVLWPDLPLEGELMDCEDLFGTSESPEMSLCRTLLDSIAAFDPAEAPPQLAIYRPDRDLRAIIRVARAAGLGLQYVDTNLVEQILRSKRREIWLRMLMDDPTLVGAFMPDFWDSVVERYDADDYVIAEKIMYRGLLQRMGDPVLLYNFDVFDVPSVFAYVDGAYYATEALLPEWKRNPARIAQLKPATYNAADNIPGYRDFMTVLDTASLDEVYARAGYLAADSEFGFDESLALADAGAWGSSLGVGSPLDPRLPYAIEVGFWVCLERAVYGDADFRRWFTQTIEIPSAFTR